MIFIGVLPINLDCASYCLIVIIHVEHSGPCELSYNDAHTDSGQWTVSTDTAMGVISGDCCGMVRYQTVMAIGQIL